MPSLLFLSTGWRFRVVERMRNVAEHLSKQEKIPYKVYAGDSNELSCSLWAAESKIFPRYDSPDFPDELISFCSSKNISGIVPTGEREYDALMNARSKLKESSTVVLMPPNETVKLCRNKLKLSAYLKKSGIPSPATMTIGDAMEKIETLNFPLFLKPTVTSHGGFIGKADSKADIEFWHKKEPHLLVQEFIEGREVTLDILFDSNGNLINFVPRERIFVRGGEVNKGKTVHDEKFEALSNKIAENFKMIGVITAQCYVKENCEPILIEINTRVGGGFPLTLAATEPDGFGTALFKMSIGINPQPNINNFREMIMMRYDHDLIFDTDLNLIEK